MLWGADTYNILRIREVAEVGVGVADAVVTGSGGVLDVSYSPALFASNLEG